jgi:hypothetical protein
LFCSRNKSFLIRRDSNLEAAALATTAELEMDAQLILFQDWPDDMKLSAEAFEEFAFRVEREDFEDDVRNLASSLHQLVAARRDSIAKLRASAKYLEAVWVR